MKPWQILICIVLAAGFILYLRITMELIPSYYGNRFRTDLPASAESWGTGKSPVALPSIRLNSSEEASLMVFFS